MRISPELTQKLQELTTPKTRRASTGSPTAPADTRAAATEKQAQELHMSPALRLIQTLYEQVSKLPEMDGHKVQKVSEQVRNGTYRVESQPIAEALLQELSR